MAKDRRSCSRAISGRSRAARHAQGGAVATFRVASSRAWQSADGTSHDETEWFRVVAWDALGKIGNT